MELTDAQTDTVYFEEEYASQNYTQLRVTLSYQGEDTRLEDWSRTWVFKLQPDGEWLVWSCKALQTSSETGTPPPCFP